MVVGRSTASSSNGGTGAAGEQRDTAVTVNNFFSYSGPSAGPAPYPDVGADPSAGTADDSEGADSAGPPLVTPAAKAAPKRRPQAEQPERVRFYCCTRVPSGLDARLGTHHTIWSQIKLWLPRNTLTGSGFHIRAFDDVASAANYWVEQGWEPPAPLH